MIYEKLAITLFPYKKRLNIVSYSGGIIALIVFFIFKDDIANEIIFFSIFFAFCISFFAGFALHLIRAYYPNHTIVNNEKWSSFYAVSNNGTKTFYKIYTSMMLLISVIFLVTSIFLMYEILK